MTRDLTTESLVDTLADEFIRRFRAGERPTVAEYLERCPNLADQIRELFPALIMLENLASPSDQGPQYSLLAGLKRPDVLGDYRILQETGRGGMGIVYEAEQISLGRHVAVKVLPFQLVSDQSAVDRFHREARAAARLQHPNIVPVYDFCQGDSVWYYAMQFIHGQSLEEVLSELQRLRDGDHDPVAQGQLLELATSLISNDHGDLKQAENLDESSLDQSPRRERIRQVVDVALQRLAAGELVSEEDLYAEYSELMPELKEQFRMLQLIEASRPPLMVDELDELGLRMQQDEKVETESEGPSPAIPSSAQKLTGLPDAKNRPQCHEYFKNTARLMLQVARALEYAHQEGVIHRDVKPSNLLLDARGQIWITDFGLAKLSSSNITSTGSFAGTLRYMAPEQIRGKCDPRTDVYGLGITLYEMLTLSAAFHSPDYLGMMKQICEEGPVAPCQVRPEIPRDLETIVLRAIERDCDSRYESAQALADDLERFISHREIRAKRGRTISRVWQLLKGRTALLSLLLLVFASVVGWFGMGYLASPRFSGTKAELAYVLAVTQAAPAIDDGGIAQAQSILSHYQSRSTFELGILRRRMRKLKVFDRLSVSNGPISEVMINGNQIYAIADGLPVQFDCYQKEIQRGTLAWADQVFHGTQGPGWFGNHEGALRWAFEPTDKPSVCPLDDDQYVISRGRISHDGQWICTTDQKRQLRLWRYSPQQQRFEAVDQELPSSKLFRFARLAHGEPAQLIIQTDSRVVIVSVGIDFDRSVFLPQTLCYGLTQDPPELLAAEDQRMYLLSTNGTRPIDGWNGIRTLHTIGRGKTIVAGLEDGAVGLWNRSTGQPILMLDEADQSIRSLALSPNQKRLVAGGQHGAIFWWDAHTEDDH